MVSEQREKEMDKDHGMEGTDGRSPQERGGGEDGGLKAQLKPTKDIRAELEESLDTAIWKSQSQCKWSW